MPIDFAKIVAMFQGPMDYQMKLITKTFERLAKWLDKKVKQTEELERSTRQFPRIDFYNEALTIWIDRSQHRLLVSATAPPGPWYSSFTRGGAAFLRGIKRVETAVREELAIPMSLGPIAGALSAISDSFDRWSEPSRKLFETEGKNIFDIFGELGLFFRAIPSSNEQIRKFLFSPLVTFFLKPSTIDWPVMLHQAIGYIVAGLLLLPLAVRWLAAAVPAFSRAVKFRVLELFRHVQDLAFDFREKALQWLVRTVMKQARNAWAFANAFMKILSDQVAFYIKFVAAYGAWLLINLRHFLEDLVDLFNSWIDTVRDIQSALKSVLDFEINSLAGPLGKYLPKITVDDLVSAAIDNARSELLQQLTDALDSAEGVADFIGQESWVVRIQALKEIFGIALTPTAPMVGEPMLPTLTHPFPDLSSLLGTGLGAAIRKHGREVAAGITEVLQSGADILAGVGDAFSKAGAQAAYIDSPARFQKIFDDSAASAKFLTQADREAALKRLGKADALATAFEQVLIHGGFDIVGDCISLYVRAMRDHWEQKVNAPKAPPKPTSPHILQKHKRLGRVHMPAITVKARGFPLGDSLIIQIAGRFQTAVEEAYSKGLARLEAVPAG